MPPSLRSNKSSHSSAIAIAYASVSAAAALRKHLAGSTHMLKKLNLILDQSKNSLLNRPDPDGATPLLTACYNGNVKDADALLRAGADPLLEGRMDYLPEEDPEDEVSFTRDEDATPRYSPLSMAARGGHTEIMEMLLARGADVNRREAVYGRSALSTACIVGQAGAVKLLLEQAGIDVNVMETQNQIGDDEFDEDQRDRYHMGTPLYAACVHGHVEVVKLLLTCSTLDVNKDGGFYSGSPLWAACENYKYSHESDRGDGVEVVRLLLAHPDIDVNYKQETFDTNPLIVALTNSCPFNNHSRAAREKERVAIVRLLMANKTLEWNDTNRFENHIVDINYLEEAMRVDESEGTNFLRVLISDSRINLDRRDRTPSLHYAAESGYEKCVILLIVYGADRQAPDRDGVSLASAAKDRALTDWLEAVPDNWSQLRIAAGCRLYKDAAAALRCGRMDPDTAGIKEMLGAIETSRTLPGKLPWAHAYTHPICEDTIKLVAAATRGWRPCTHWLHHPLFRQAIYAVQVVACRLDNKGAACTAAEEEKGVAAAGADGTKRPPSKPTGKRRSKKKRSSKSVPTPVLPPELWHHVCGFLQRSWWEVVHSAPFDVK